VHRRPESGTSIRGKGHEPPLTVLAEDELPVLAVPVDSEVDPVLVDDEEDDVDGVAVPVDVDDVTVDVAAVLATVDVPACV
jgi:hypothetical protein